MDEIPSEGTPDGAPGGAPNGILKVPSTGLGRNPERRTPSWIRPVQSLGPSLVGRLFRPDPVSNGMETNIHTEVFSGFIIYQLLGYLDDMAEY